MLDPELTDQEVYSAIPARGEISLPDLRAKLVRGRLGNEITGEAIRSAEDMAIPLSYALWSLRRDGRIAWTTHFKVVRAPKKRTKK